MHIFGAGGGGGGGGENMKILRGLQHACHPETTTAMSPGPTPIARADKPAELEDGMEPSVGSGPRELPWKRKVDGGFPDKLASGSLETCQLGALKGGHMNDSRRSLQSCL